VVLDVLWYCGTVLLDVLWYCGTGCSVVLWYWMFCGTVVLDVLCYCGTVVLDVLGDCGTVVLDVLWIDSVPNAAVRERTNIKDVVEVALAKPCGKNLPAQLGIHYVNVGHTNRQKEKWASRPIGRTRSRGT
jgi:hypothetical protein